MEGTAIPLGRLRSTLHSFVHVLATLVRLVQLAVDAVNTAILRPIGLRLWDCKAAVLGVAIAAGSQRCRFRSIADSHSLFDGSANGR